MDTNKSWGSRLDEWCESAVNSFDNAISNAKPAVEKTIDTMKAGVSNVGNEASAVYAELKQSMKDISNSEVFESTGSKLADCASMTSAAFKKGVDIATSTYVKEKFNNIQNRVKSVFN